MKLFDIAFCPFPEELHGHFGGFATYSREKNRYQILIDNQQPEEVQRKFLRHEFGHILAGHLAIPQEQADDSWEAEADAYADAISESEFSVLLSLSNQFHHDEVRWCLP